MGVYRIDQRKSFLRNEAGAIISHVAERLAKFNAESSPSARLYSDG
jgi:hypothetical protein